MGPSKPHYLDCGCSNNLLWLRVAAIYARGLRESRITVYTTRDSANQAFVDAYMGSRVSAYPAPHAAS